MYINLHGLTKAVNKYFIQRKY